MSPPTPFQWPAIDVRGDSVRFYMNLAYGALVQVNASHASRAEVTSKMADPAYGGWKISYYWTSGDPTRGKYWIDDALQKLPPPMDGMTWVYAEGEPLNPDGSAPAAKTGTVSGGNERYVDLDTSLAIGTGIKTIPVFFIEQAWEIQPCPNPAKGLPPNAADCQFWLSAAYGGGGSAPISQPVGSPALKTTTPWQIWAIGGAAVVAAGGLGYWAYRRGWLGRIRDAFDRAAALPLLVLTAIFVALITTAGCSASQRQAESAAIKAAEVRFVKALDKFCKLEETQPVNATLTAVACGVDWAAHVVIPTPDWESATSACDGGCPPP
jgi:hypothetical protein